MDCAVKQRYRRAVKMALKELKSENCLAFRVEGEIDIVAIDQLSHARAIKICLGEENIPKIKKPANIPVELWVRKKGEKDFKKIGPF